MKRFKRGDLVYDKADPRHVGVVCLVSTTGRKVFACVRWCSTGWLSSRLPAGSLRRAPKQLADGAYNELRKVRGEKWQTNLRV